MPVITNAALDKIILAVCEPVTLDQSKREGLRREIENAAAEYSDAVIFHDLGRARTLETRLTVFRKAAERLDAQLADETFYNLIESTLIIHGLDSRVVSRIFRTFGLAERHPALAHAVMAPLICWSFSSSMFRYLFVDHAVPAMWRNLAAARLSAD